MTIPVVVEEIVGKYTLFTWPDMVMGDDGEPVEIYDFADRTIQCKGSPNRLTLQGTNVLDGMPWYMLANGSTYLTWNMLNPGKPHYNGSLYIFNPRYVRPNMAGGTPTQTDVPTTVTLFCTHKH